ncbi:Eco57I restriction-modification methylase domain-containing protein [Halorubrum sp. DTA98]|uniref:Eco57I restriction-modification methylase domain-containing protein n=1 Tax=Halorubrum sp. DTA98 TaxID=3402163 RepID=UPI003AAD9FD9
MPATLDAIRDRLDNSSSHNDVRTRVNPYLEELLGWTLTTEVDSGSGGSIDSVPVTNLGNRDIEIPAFVIEYKKGESESTEELEEKSGGKSGETAIGQLERYVTQKKICNFGFLVDASRFVVYRRQGDSLHDDPESEIVFAEAIDSDFEELEKLVPLVGGLPDELLKIEDPWEFADTLQASIEQLTPPLQDLFDIIEPEEYDLLLEIIPSGLSEEEFVQKTAASLVSKVMLLRAMEDQNNEFGIVLNPEVMRQFSKSPFGYILAFSSAYDLGAMNFPQVMKADIDVFDWWVPTHHISEVRRNTKDAHLELNGRLANVLNQLYWYEVEFQQDLMGMTYQKLRKKGETAVLGSYFTPPQLTDTTVDAVDTLVGDLGITDYTRRDLYDKPDFKVIDPTCGSGTFFISYIKKAIKETNRAPSDTANTLIKKLHGIDIDPLAVLMARAQIYGSLSPHLSSPPSPSVYWSNTLDHIQTSQGQSVLDQFNKHSDIGAPIDEVRYDMERADKEITKGSFDLVIGNPPWGRRGEIVRHLRDVGHSREDANDRIDHLVPEVWRDHFDTRDDNLLTPFVIAGDRLLKEGGVMAFVLDARFQASEWGGEVVEMLNDYDEVRVLDVSQSSDAEFRESVSYPAIVLGVK